MDYDVIIGLDVGKAMHHACVLGPDGKRLADRDVANTETALRGVFAEMAVEGRVLLVVDQLHSIGALPVTVAQAMGIDTAYLRGCRCGDWRTCIRATPRPKPGMRTSSGTPP